MNITLIKKKIFDVIEPSDQGSKASKIFDVSIITLIIINVALVVADTFDAIGEFRGIFYVIEYFSVAVFTVEYILRLWTADLLHPDQSKAKAYIRYIFSFMALIDLTAILPFYLPFLFSHDLIVVRSLRIARIFRLFKFNRYTDVLSDIGAVFKKKAGQLISSTFVVFLMMLITSVLMYNVEHAAQPDKFTNTFDALWWTIATITTVGYGDIYPITMSGQILSGITALLGIGLVAIPTGIIAAGFMEQTKQAKDEKDTFDKKCFCPYCGNRINDR